MSYPYVTDLRELDTRERAVAAALFRVGAPQGIYSETPDGAEWLAADASSVTAAWDDRGREGVRGDLLDSAALDVEDPLYGAGLVDAVVDVLGGVS